MTNEIVDGGAQSAKTRAMEFHRQGVRYLVVHRLACLVTQKKNPDREGYSHDRGDDAMATAFNIVYETNVVRKLRYAKSCAINL